MRSRLFRWHCENALDAATSIVSCGPSSSSDAKSTAYDTDIVEPLLASGRLTLNAEVIADVRRRSAKSGRSLNSECGPSHTTRRAPIAIVAPTYKRAGNGRERMCAVLAYEPHTALDRVASATGRRDSRLGLLGRLGARFIKTNGV